MTGQAPPECPAVAQGRTGLFNRKKGLLGRRLAAETGVDAVFVRLEMAARA